MRSVSTEKHESLRFPIATFCVSPFYTDYANGSFRASDFRFSFHQGYFKEFSSTNISKLWEKSNHGFDDIPTSVYGKEYKITYLTGSFN